MTTSTLIQKTLGNRSRKTNLRRRRKQKNRTAVTAPESLEVRQLLTAALAWDGDVLEVEGSADNDFIAVQQDALGVRVFSGDAVYSEFEGRSFDTASSINVAGNGGNDVLISYQTEVPVSLNGDDGNDFLYSDKTIDALEGGAGFDWVHSDGTRGISTDAFGVPGFDLDITNLNSTPSFDDVGRVSLDVEIAGDIDIADHSVEFTGLASIDEAGVDVSLNGTVGSWENAFGIEGVELADTSLTVNAGTDVNEGDGYSAEIASTLVLSETEIGVVGTVDVSEDLTNAVFTGSVASLDNAFGVEGLDLTNAELTASGTVDPSGSQSLSFGVMADLDIEDTIVAVEGSVDVEPDRIDAVLTGSVDVWDDAFGVEGLDLADGELTVTATSDREEDFELGIDLSAQLMIDDVAIDVLGSVDITPDQIDAFFGGTVEEWDDAFGIEGLDLTNTELGVAAYSNRRDDADLRVDLAGDLDIVGTDVRVEGSLDIEPDLIAGSLTGVIGGTWTSAFGVVPLELQDTTLTIAGTRTVDESTLEIGVDASVSVLGADLGVTGSVEFTPDGIATTLTGTIAGEWSAAGVIGLQLRDTSVTLSAETGYPDLDISLDTDVELFGNYIDVIGDLEVSSDGIDLSFSPPESIDFTNLFGIEGFSLNDAGLTVTAATDGLSVAIDSTVELGDIDVAFEGAFSITPNSVEASLTGRVAEWENAFDVPGLNLNDVALTLGAEAGVGGASVTIGLGAGIEIGSSEVTVAGFIGYGTTGLEAGFRGEIDELEGDDLIDFANTLNRAANPDAQEIADGTLGDLELRDAFINFAPKGGNEVLGIEDGFGIGGAFYNGDTLLGSGGFVVDLAGGVFEANLDIPKLDLGPLEISDVVIDVRIAPVDSHYEVAGTATLLGAHVEVDGAFSQDSFSLTGTAGVDIQGLAASVTFHVDQSGVSYVATAGGGAINQVKDNLTKDIRAVATVAQKAIDVAQDAVDVAESKVDDLEADLEEARADAQKTIDEIKAKIDKASSVVASALSSRNYWNHQKNVRYSAWRSAVAATNRAKWYQKAKYKAIEVSRYASYRSAWGRYNTQVVVHNAAVVAHKAVVASADWALDSAGVEASPKVIALKASIALANVAVDAAEIGLNGVEKANAGVLAALAKVESLKVNTITISGSLADFNKAAVGVRIDYEFAGRSQSLDLEVSTDDFVQNIGKKLLAEVV